MPATVHALIYPQSPTIISERRVIDLVNVPAHKRPWWRPVETVGDNSFDPATQKKTGPVTTIEADRVVDTYTITPLSAQEISDLKDARIAAVDALQFAIAFDMENRVRVLEGKPAVTQAQYRAALKARL